MFGILKKKLRQSVETLVKKAETEEPQEAAEAPSKEAAAAQREEAEAPQPTKKGGLSRLTGRITVKEFSESEIDSFFSDIETDLLQANLALEVIDHMKAGLKERLVGKPVPRKDAKSVIRGTFREILLGIVAVDPVDIEGVIKAAKAEGRPACILFLGFNGSGKTTTIAKISDMLKRKGYRPVLAAADTFRAASIEQLQVHADRLGIGVIKHQYGADPAAVIFDARKHAESRKLDVVMADSAGRMHTNANLMDELKKIIRVNKPDLRILVVDSLTGNDVVSQVRTFSEEVGIDGLVLTKMDVNEKGGSVISACYTSGKPVLYIGRGQEYSDLERFDPERFVDGILE